MSETQYDYGDAPEARSQTSVTDTTPLERLCLDLEERDAEIERLTAELAKKQAAADVIRNVEIPSLMEQMGSNLIELERCNLRVTLKRKNRANIKKDDEAEVFDWFEEIGNGKIIKREFHISFSREDEAWANKFEADLAKRKRPLDVERKKTIPNPSLVKFVNEALEAGKKLHPKIGVYPQPFVALKRTR